MKSNKQLIDERNKERLKTFKEAQKSCGCRESSSYISTGGVMICKHYNFAVVFPEFKKYWLDERDPTTIAPKSGIKVLMACKLECGSPAIPCSPCAYIQSIGCEGCNGHCNEAGVIAPWRSIAVIPEVLALWSPRNIEDPKTISSGMRKEFWWKCEKGHEWPTEVYHVCRGTRCPECNRLSMISPWADVLTKCREAWGDTYDYDEKSYIQATLKITVICRREKHGPFRILLQPHLKGTGCQECMREQRDSKGIRVIKKFFDLCNLSYIPEKRFDDLRGFCSGALLPCDLYIEMLDESILEYDGKQHFIFVPSWHKSIQSFNDQLSRDLLKDKHAIDNGYNFIRIPYWLTTNQIVEILVRVMLLIRQGSKVYMSYSRFSTQVNHDGYIHADWIIPDILPTDTRPI